MDGTPATQARITGDLSNSLKSLIWSSYYLSILFYIFSPTISISVIFHHFSYKVSEIGTCLYSLCPITLSVLPSCCLTIIGCLQSVLNHLVPSQGNLKPLMPAFPDPSPSIPHGPCTVVFLSYHSSWGSLCAPTYLCLCLSCLLCPPFPTFSF